MGNTAIVCVMMKSWDLCIIKTIDGLIVDDLGVDVGKCG